MRQTQQQGFMLRALEVQHDVLIPRYYDPRIGVWLESLSAEYFLPTLQELIDQKQVVHSHGSYVPKIHYGTGPYPYIRTSDLANWEIKASPKHGVAKDVYDEYANKQDVRPCDILLVHEGTYLIGSTAMVTPFDARILYQHHLAKLRVLENAPFGPYFLLAALETRLVNQQFRSKQFTADTIDSIVGRLTEVVIPVPRDFDRIAHIDDRVKEAILGRAQIREGVSTLLNCLDLWLHGDISDSIGPALAGSTSDAATDREAKEFLGQRRRFTSFVHDSSRIQNDVLVPKYYDPALESLLTGYRDRCEIVTFGDLVREGVIEYQTGDEIGRLNYGTGTIPFVRTSDFGSWEVKREPKQGVSEAVYDEWKLKQDIRSQDILLVRDGTYLVGSSVLVSDYELPMLICGGVFRIRCIRRDRISPILLFALLNLPFVHRQIRSKQFTRDVIDTLGRRIEELILPVPKDANDSVAIVSSLGALLQKRGTLHVEMQRIVEELYPGPVA